MINLEIDYKAIGIRIRRKRTDMGLTQQKMAELAGLEPSNISHIERGATKLSLPTIVRIANVLHSSVDELLCDSLEIPRHSYEKAASEILSGCSNQQKAIITESMLCLKENLIKYQSYIEQ